MTQTHVESKLEFQFKTGLEVVKFDESSFFTQHFNKLIGSKGVDFLVDDPEGNVLYFIEVKNFTGHETENKKRLKVNTEFSLALEVSQKVRDSISCLVGAYKMGNDTAIIPFFHRLRQHNVQVKVILFLEGAFHEEIKMFRAMSDEMKVRLNWLTTKVLIENVRFAKESIYSISKAPYSS